MKLDNRMLAVAAMVPAGSKIADIGTDHAYLPIHLVAEGRVEYAVAGDVHKGPYNSALNAVSYYGLTDKIRVRLGDGLKVVEKGEVNTAIIAGMGGATIIDILKASPEIIGSLSRLVLQPMLAAGSVRRWLTENGWMLVDETIAEEDGILYEIIAAEPGAADKIEPILYEIGPIIWQRRHPLLKRHLAETLDQLRRIVKAMSGSASASCSPRYREYQEKIALLEEKYTCL